MGLDSMFFVTKKTNTAGDFKVKDDRQLEEIAYFRKFWGLHKWMEGLARLKDREIDAINGVYLRLNDRELHDLLLDAKGLTSKEEYNGIWEWEEERDKLFTAIAKAFTELDKGRAVYYYGDY